MPGYYSTKHHRPYHDGRYKRDYSRPRPSLAGRGGIDSGVHRLLETPLVCGGVAMTRVLAHVAFDATTAAWTARFGQALSIAGAGADPVVDLDSPHLGSLDELLRWMAGKYYQAGDNAYGNCGSDDIVLEWLGWLTSGGKTHLSKFAANKGYQLDTVGSTANLAIANGAGYTYVATAALTVGAINLCHWFLRRATSGQAYRWGARSGAAVDISARAGDSDAAAAFTLGASTAGGALADGGVGIVQIWRGVLDTHLQDTVAAQRAALLSGSRPLISCAGATSLAAGGSTSPAHQRKVTSGVTRLHYMGAGAPRFERVTDADGREFVGAYVEAGATQALYPAIPKTWTKSDAGDSFAADVAGPNGVDEAAAWVLSATSGNHALTSSGTIAAGNTAVYWAVVKNGPLAKNWIALAPDGAGIIAYFNLATGASGGHAGANWLAQGIVSLGGGWYLCWVRHTTAGLTARIYAADGDGDITLAGDAATVAYYLWHAQLELGSYPSSAIKSTTGSVVRAADAPHRISGAAHFGPKGFSLFGEVLCAVFTPSRNHHLWTAYKSGSAATEYVKCFIDTAGKLNVTSATAAGAAGAVITAGALNDNVVRKYCVSFGENRLRLWVDGAEVTKDVAVNLVADLDTLDFGADEGAANQAGPGVWPGSRYQLLDYPVEDWLPEPGGFVF